MKIAQAEYAWIGGSSTLSCVVGDLSADVKLQVLASDMIFSTPYGDSPKMQYWQLTDIKGQPRRILHCAMHGWRSGVTRADASRQIFYVFQQAGVKEILADGGVGAINNLLDLKDVVIPHDYMDFSMRQDVGLQDHYLLMMREPMCPSSSRILWEQAQKLWPHRVFPRSVYVNTDGRHFESVAEVNFYKMAGGDVIGQSIAPEVYLAREIGACYTGIYMIVNYAEGQVKPWQHEDLEYIFYNYSTRTAQVIIETFRHLAEKEVCACSDFRKPTLLKGVY